MSKLPETGFLRLKHIIGDPKAKPPISGLLPMSKSSWWDGIKKGIFPKSIKMGPNMTAWRVEDIAELIARLGAQCTDSADG
ncbi:AlpA family phage regulatory protein [Methylococcaceae bacterium WWC4]|nr:AlpA family phage regulatory protein [Methylococcaceae bacterium WWC4]